MWAPYSGWFPCHCTPDCPAPPIVRGGWLAVNGSDNNGIASQDDLKISDGNIIFQPAPAGIRAGIRLPPSTLRSSRILHRNQYQKL
jgi:hypothetical protein